MAASFSHPIAPAEVPPGGREIRIVADAVARAAVARLLDIPSVPQLEAVLRLRRFRRDGIAVSGEIQARVEQVCVVTLEPFESEVTVGIDARFVPPAPAAPAQRRRAAARGEDGESEAGGPVDLDEPDELVGGRVDLGALVVEFLSLALDPYPRKPGVVFEVPGEPSDLPGSEPGAFDALDRAGRTEREDK